MRNSADDISCAQCGQALRNKAPGISNPFASAQWVHFMFFGWRGCSLSLVCLVRCSEGCKSLSMLFYVIFDDESKVQEAQKHRLKLVEPSVDAEPVHAIAFEISLFCTALRKRRRHSPRPDGAVGTWAIQVLTPNRKHRR